MLGVFYNNCSKISSKYLSIVSHYELKLFSIDVDVKDKDCKHLG